jgi:hypothetical protein
MTKGVGLRRKPALPGGYASNAGTDTLWRLATRLAWPELKSRRRRHSLNYLQELHAVRAEM